MALYEQLAGFFSDTVYLQLAVVTALLFAATLVIWLMYVQISRRDLFRMKKPHETKATPGEKLAYFLKYTFLFPAITFLWYLVFVIILRLLSAKSVGDILFIGIALISAIRISAYVNQRLAEDLAKTLPLVLIAGILLDPSFITFQARLSDLYVFGGEIPSFMKYLLFTVVLEFVLRTLYRIRNSQGEKAEEKNA
ncbi:MAG: hypothetical protein HY367_03635 [Candidatus Aenigmarchaeota archaeon]|nr:hypothetical protein [Candidatus Aenigmarchaeota archaeon]